MRKFLTMMGLLFVFSNAVWAADMKTAMLAVDKMTCDVCPITVKRALKEVNGVTQVETKYEGNGVGWAKVTFDASKTKLDDLTFATEVAGYPSRLKEYVKQN